MSIRRGLLAVASVLVLVIAAGCSDDESSDGGGGGSDDPITIGLLVPLTGAVAQSSEIVENATQLAADQINEAGGIDGRDVEVESYDTELEPEVAAQQAQRAITEDGVTALIGPWATSEALAVREVVERAEVVDINMSAADPTITEGSDYVFRTSPVTTDLAAAMVDLSEQLGAENAVLMYDSGGFGLGAVDPITAAAEEAGFELTGTVEFPVSATDVTNEVATAADGDPGAVLTAGSTGADYGLVANAMVEQGLDVPYIGFSPIVLPDAVEIGGDAYAELPGVYTLQMADTTKDSYQELLAAYNAEYDEVENLPEQVLGAWDAMQFLADGLEVTGGEGGEALATALEGIEAREGVNGAAGTEQVFTDDDHDANQGAYLVPYVMEDGQPVQATEIQLGG